ncbi:LCP family protein [Umezawaea sp. Da 62-37]|uniref:LCP family protein n=1 Tax=Umezawaea sp. Da 62-37 TaxID=3075927 RepID=UPI0028F73838|nr:LCP family protein [Umezawaea sp. Da 62-37]WNV82776.1 LCP family protein [Umezawaea sp. Da 62-37]
MARRKPISATAPTERVAPARAVRPPSERPKAVPERLESPSRRVPPRQPAASGGSIARRSVVSLLSVAVLLGTGYAWQNLKSFTDNLTTTDVINAGAGGEKPADGAIDILMVGMDSRTDAKGNPLPQQILDELQAGGSDDGGLNTDTLILMHIPNDGKKAVAMSFPRDSYVKIANGYGRHKINSAFAYGKNDSAAELTNKGGLDPAEIELESKKEGAKNLIATIQDLTGVTIDHYAEINLVGFYDITKAVGGVDVCLNEATQDDFSGADFAAGQQTIEGKAALAFVRQRHGLLRGDLDRVVRQQVFMAGLAKKMLSAGVLSDQTKTTNLINAVTKSIVLDKDWDILNFANQMKSLSGGAMEFQTIPTGDPELETPEDGQAIEIDEAAVKKFVKGLTEEPGASSAPSTPSKPFDNASVTVEVRNASGVPGLAAQVLESLTAKGFVSGDAANAEVNASASSVKYGKGGDEGAAAVAKILGGVEVEQDNDIQVGHVRVFVGSDYAGPGAQGLVGGGGVGLDGVREQQPSAEAPITADGVRCVN